MTGAATPAGWIDRHGMDLALLVGVWVVVVVAHSLVFAIARRRTQKEESIGERSLLTRVRRPVLIAALLAVTIVLLPTLPIPEEVARRLAPWMRAGVVASITWALVAAISVIDDVIMRKFDVSVSDNLRARRMHTRARVLVRSAMTLVAVGGVAGVLMQFETIRLIGTGLLASAGIVGLAVGFAAKPVLGNLIAGVQIALAEPIRLGDAVVVEGEWGWIEEITSTYVVVKVWDERRLITPLSHFIEKPFQNWTRTRADLIGAVTLHVDYACPLGEMDAELTRLVEDNERWDRRVRVLQVIDAGERTMVVRALVSAKDSPTAWDLRCDVRRGLVEWLQREHPEALPRVRLDGDRPA